MFEYTYGNCAGCESIYVTSSYAIGWLVHHYDCLASWAYVY